MKYLHFSVLAALWAAASAFAQTATLTASNETLAPQGGSVVLTATANFEGEPAALGWAIELPADWTLESVGGANVPAILPEIGATGTLEFAFTTVPVSRAEFSVIVRYPAGTTAVKAASTVLVREGGKLTTLTPAVVEMRAASSGPARKSRN